MEKANAANAQYAYDSAGTPPPQGQYQQPQTQQQYAPPPGSGSRI